MESSRSNRLRRFGEQMPALLNAIQEAHRKCQFKHRPRGPLGKTQLCTGESRVRNEPFEHWSYGIMKHKLQYTFPCFPCILNTQSCKTIFFSFPHISKAQPNTSTFPSLFKCFFSFTGFLISLRDPELALAVEVCLKGQLLAFTCDNYEDEKVLQGLMAKVFPGARRPAIITSNFLQQVHDTRRKWVQNGFRLKASSIKDE